LFIFIGSFKKITARLLCKWNYVDRRWQRLIHLYFCQFANNSAIKTKSVPLRQHALCCCIHDQSRSFQAKKEDGHHCTTPKKGAVQQAHAIRRSFVRPSRSCTQSGIRLIASPTRSNTPASLIPWYMA
jgi:hypothetical protein